MRRRTTKVRKSTARGEHETRLDRDSADRVNSEKVALESITQKPVAYVRFEMEFLFCCLMGFIDSAHTAVADFL